MTNDEFNPLATDGDGDGMVQDGTEWERPVEDAATEPELVLETLVEAPEVVEDAVVTSPEPVETTPALTPVEDGVIGSGKTSKKKPAAKKVSAPPVEVDKVALFAERNLVWQGVGKVQKGYNIVGKEAAAKWLTLATIREATPEEIKSLG